MKTKLQIEGILIQEFLLLCIPHVPKNCTGKNYVGYFTFCFEHPQT